MLSQEPTAKRKRKHVAQLPTAAAASAAAAAVVPPKRAPQWLTVASCDVGSRSLSCVVADVNVANSNIIDGEIPSFVVRDWWVTDLFRPEWLAKQERARKRGNKTIPQPPTSGVVKALHVAMTAASFFGGDEQRRAIDVVLIEQQFRPNQRMQALSHAFATNVYWLMPRAAVVSVSSNNKMRLIERHDPDFKQRYADAKAVRTTTAGMKTMRKKASVALTRLLLASKVSDGDEEQRKVWRQRLEQFDALKKKDDAADSLLQLLSSTAQIRKASKAMATAASL